MPEGPTAPEANRPNRFFSDAREKIAKLFKPNQQAIREDTSDVLKPSLTRRKLLKLGAAGVSAVLAQTVLPTEQAKAKTLVDTLASLGAPQAQESATVQKEKTPFSPKITIIDAAPDHPVEGLNQQEFISSEDMLKNIFGDTYIPKERLIEEFGENYRMVEVQKKYPQALLLEFVTNYFNHGEDVASVMSKTWDKLGYKNSPIEMKPLQQIFDTTSAELVVDGLGNVGYSLNFDPKKLIALLQNDPSKVVNFSFQVGDVEILMEQKRIKIPEPQGIPNVEIKSDLADKPYDFDGKVYLSPLPREDGISIVTDIIKNGKLIPADVNGVELSSISVEEYEETVRQKRGEARQHAQVIESENPGITIKGAYRKEKAEVNLNKLFEVCNAYPDKLFCVAVGNEGEDIREAMEKFVQNGSKPNNLITVAQWGGRNWGPERKVYGADLYVPNGNLGAGHGSSFSTPIVSALAERLFDKGLAMDEVKRKIFSYSVPRVYKDEEFGDNTALVLDPDKVGFGNFGD